jgi:hypothetical protein
MTTSNGFPNVNIHDAMDIWKLGNMAFGWAKQPLALDDGQLELFVDLCKRYNLEPAVVLQHFQRIAWKDLAKAQMDQTFPPAMPMEQTAVLPTPSPHPRHNAVRPGQTSAGRPVTFASYPGTAGEESVEWASCGGDSKHPVHQWQDEVEGVPAEWYMCDGEPFVDDDPEQKTGIYADNDPAVWKQPERT